MDKVITRTILHAIDDSNKFEMRAIGNNRTRFVVYDEKFEERARFTAEVDAYDYASREGAAYIEEVYEQVKAIVEVADMASAELRDLIVRHIVRHSVYIGGYHSVEWDGIRFYAKDTNQLRREIEGYETGKRC